MRLPKLAIENRQFTMIVIMLLILSGVVSLVNMPRSEDPTVSPPGSSVIVIYPGANPKDMEELVVDPIEEEINELEDIKRLTSSAGDGLAIVGVEFEVGSDPDEKYSDVVQKVNSVRNDLPEGILSLETNKWSVTDVNILQIALVSKTSSYRLLEEEAERLKKELEKTPGVKNTAIRAFPVQEVRIALDLERMALQHISMSMAIGAIRQANQNIPGGNIDMGDKRFNIKTSGSYGSLEEIGNTIVQAAGGKIVFLKDVADVEFSYEDKKYYARYNGERAVFVTVAQKEGTNIFDVMDNLKQKIKDFQVELPKSISLNYVFDQSESVANRVNGFFINLLQGLVLVGMVVFFAVGFRASTIVMMAIPISILIAIGFIDLSDYGIQQMTIAGLIIALGLLVDNAIVVTENISRFMEKGYSDEEAASQGTSQIAWAIVSATGTTVLAFVPMMMIQNITGDFIRSMPVTVVYTLAASLLISLTLTPYLSSKFLSGKEVIRQSRIRKFMNWFIENHYQKRLSVAIANPKKYILLAILVFVISLGLFPLVGVSFFPKAEKPQFIININTPSGTGLDKTDRVAKFVETELQNHEEIRRFATNVGHGNPRIYYNVVPENEKSTHAQIFVELEKYQPNAFDKFIKSLRSKFTDYPGAEIEVKEFEQGPPVEAPIAIRINGENMDVLKKLSRDVEIMIRETEGTINTNNPLRMSKTDLHVNINRDKAGMLGVSLAEIDQTVRGSIAGLDVSSYRDAEGKDYDIVVRLPIEDEPTLKDFDKIYVSSGSGAQIPLNQIAALEFQSTPMEITHYNLERNVTVTSDVMSGYSVNLVTQQIIDKLEDYDWPKGNSYSIGGELESRQESFGGMFQAILLAVVAIFAVLVLQFRSYAQPLIVFSAIPLALVGSIVALLITGNTFSFTAFVGLTSLVGIVVNNSIILVDYTNQLRRDGWNIVDAIQEAGQTRFIPIILTTATTIGGLLPLTLGGGTLWAPMGWTIIGGLIASTFLTLIIVPVLYKLFTRVK